MKKTVLFIALLFAQLTFAHDMGTALKLTDGRTLKEVNEMFKTLDSADETFKFKVVEFDEHLNSAKRVAKYMAATLFEGLNTSEPQFCGSSVDGQVTEKYVGKNHYVISGRGDGGSNSCTGEGYPGGWDFTVDVTYDKTTNSGTAKISFYQE